MMIHTQRQLGQGDCGFRATVDLHAVMLADGKWYWVEDPTLPEGPDGYLSFLQGHPGFEKKIMVNVPISEIKAVSYFGMPEGVSG